MWKIVKLKLLLSWPYPTTKILILNQVRDGHVNTLLSYIFCQFFPLAKPNQKPEGKAAQLIVFWKKSVWKWIQYGVGCIAQTRVKQERFNNFLKDPILYQFLIFIFLIFKIFFIYFY